MKTTQQSPNIPLFAKLLRLFNVKIIAIVSSEKTIKTAENLPENRRFGCLALFFDFHIPIFAQISWFGI